MRARLPGQRHRLRRAATADDKAGPQDARGHLHGEMPDPASAARDIDGVADLHSAVEAPEGGGERQKERSPKEETQGFLLGDGLGIFAQRKSDSTDNPDVPA